MSNFKVSLSSLLADDEMIERISNEYNSKELDIEDSDDKDEDIDFNDFSYDKVEMAEPEEATVGDSNSKGEQIVEEMIIENL